MSRYAVGQEISLDRLSRGEPAEVVHVLEGALNTYIVLQVRLFYTMFIPFCTGESTVEDRLHDEHPLHPSFDQIDVIGHESFVMFYHQEDAEEFCFRQNRHDKVSLQELKEQGK